MKVKNKSKMRAQSQTTPQVTQLSQIPQTLQAEKVKIPIKPQLSISNCTRDTHYKMIIPLPVEKKIRQLCTEVHDVEWSGILFYDYEGTFEDGNLVIKCKDFLLMDIGSSAYTEFENSKDILDYSDKHPELDNYLHMQGLVH